MFFFGFLVVWGVGSGVGCKWGGIFDWRDCRGCTRRRGRRGRDGALTARYAGTSSAGSGRGRSKSGSRSRRWGGRDSGLAARGLEGSEDGLGGAAFFDEVFGGLHRFYQGGDGGGDEGVPGDLAVGVGPELDFRGRGPAVELAGKFRDLKGREATEAATRLLSAVAEGSFRWLCDERLAGALSTAVVGARRRDVGDGVWKWSRVGSDVDISTIEAMTWALWAAPLLAKSRPVLL